MDVSGQPIGPDTDPLHTNRDLPSGEATVKIKTLTIAAAVSVAMVGAAEARDQIRMVGSSTVFPFSTAVAEQFGKSSNYNYP